MLHVRHVDAAGRVGCYAAPDAVRRRGPDGKPWDNDKTGDGAVLTLAVAPIDDGMRGYAALSVSATTGLKVTEEQVRTIDDAVRGLRLELADLIHTQRRSERQVRQANVLVNSAKLFQAKRSVEGLAESVCADALQITGGARATLVKWDVGAQSGFVQSASSGRWMSPVTRSSSSRAW